MSGRERAPRLPEARPSAPTVTDAKEALEAGRRRNEFPRVVIIDNWLGGHRVPGVATEGGLALMKWISEKYGDQRPICVLVSGRMSPTLAYTFCNLGGHHAIDTVRYAPAWRDRVAILWRALGGERWRPSPYPPKVHFNPDELELLPLLEAGKGNSEIRAVLSWSPDKLTYVRKSIYKRLTACKLIDVEYNAALTTALSDAALAGGAIWEPLYAAELTAA